MAAATGRTNGTTSRSDLDRAERRSARRAPARPTGRSPAGHEATGDRGHDGPQPGDDPAQAADRADELVACGPESRQPHQDHPHDPAEERDHQQDQGGDLQTRGGGPGGPRLDAGAFAGLGGDVGRVAEAFQQGADAGLGLGIELGPGGGDVLADLVQELLAAVGGQVVELGLQLLEVAEDQGVGFGGHGLPPCRSRRSTASVKRSHSVANRASACWPWAVSW